MDYYSHIRLLHRKWNQQKTKSPEKTISINNDERFVLHRYTFFPVSLIFFCSDRKNEEHDIVVNTACIRYIIYGFWLCFVLCKMANMPKTEWRKNKWNAVRRTFLSEMHNMYWNTFNIHIIDRQCRGFKMNWKPFFFLNGQRVVSSIERNVISSKLLPFSMSLSRGHLGMGAFHVWLQDC